MPKTLVLLCDGVSVRNFMCTSVFRELAAAGPVSVRHALPEAAIDELRAHLGVSEPWPRLPAYRERLRERLLRHAKKYASLTAMRGEDQVMTFRPSSLRGRVVDDTARLLGGINGSLAGAARLHRRHERLVASNPATAAAAQMLREDRPDVVLCMHQRASIALPAMVAARRAGIPAVTFVFSWDNLPKGRMTVPADHYLVWSRHMAGEMARYYPDVPPDRVHITGTPQFEVHVNESLIEPRGDFLRRIGADPARPVVCFSGDDVTTSPHDPAFLDSLAGVTADLDPAPTIVFRRCPVDWSDRYDDVIARHSPRIVVADPVWRRYDGDWSQVLPTVDDAAMLANLCRHSDVVVNYGSTMGIDFAAHDKPAIYLRWTPDSARDGWDAETAYRLPHFRLVHPIEPFDWARSPAELRERIAAALADPSAKSAARREIVATVTLEPKEEAGARIAAAVTRIAAQSR
jgi:hypothetical protein